MEEEPAEPRDWVRLLARVLFVVGCLVLALEIAQWIVSVWSFIRPPVPRGISTFNVTPIFGLSASVFLAPVGPFAAWGVLTLLADIRDSLLPEEDYEDAEL